MVGFYICVRDAHKCSRLNRMKKGLLALFSILTIRLYSQIYSRCKGTNFVGHMQIFINFLNEIGMENLLNYFIIALLGHHVTNVYSHDGSGHNALTGRAWTLILEGHVYFTLDESDLSIIRSLYEERKPWMIEEERMCYEEIFNLCV